MKYKGQCFLCQRDTTLTRVQSIQGGPVYRCPHCGGNNSASRIEERRDNAGRVCEDFGPVHDG